MFIYSTFRFIPTIFRDFSTLEVEDKALLWNLLENAPRDEE